MQEFSLIQSIRHGTYNFGTHRLHNRQWYFHFLCEFIEYKYEIHAITLNKQLIQSIQIIYNDYEIQIKYKS